MYKFVSAIIKPPPQRGVGTRNVPENKFEYIYLKFLSK